MAICDQTELFGRIDDLLIGYGAATSALGTKQERPRGPNGPIIHTGHSSGFPSRAPERSLKLI